MSTTIPAVRLRERAELQFRIYRHSAYAYAESLRSNRIDWLAATNLIQQMRQQMHVICNALSGVAFDLPAERAQIERIRDDFDVLMDSLQDDLRKNYLLNGPATRRAS